MSYSEFLHTRIFTPLGMTRTHPTFCAMSAAGDPNTSKPHYLIRDTIRVISEVGSVNAASGGTWSTANDMAQWARFLVDSARVNGTRLISAENFAQLFQPQVLVPEEEFYESMQLTRPRWTSYGLGWFQQDYNGRYIAFHTGSLPGRTAIIGLVPDHRMAVIVFGNLDHAELRQALMLRAIDVFAGTNGAPFRDWSAELLELYAGLRQQAVARRQANDAKRIPGTRPTLPLEAYAGTYTHPAWGPYVITEWDGRLHATMGVGELNTGSLEHWQYDTFRVTFGDGRWNPIPLHFVVGPDGTVARLLYRGNEKYTFARVR